MMREWQTLRACAARGGDCARSAAMPARYALRASTPRRFAQAALLRVMRFDDPHGAYRCRCCASAAEVWLMPSPLMPYADNRKSRRHPSPTSVSHAPPTSIRLRCR